MFFLSFFFSRVRAVKKSSRKRETERGKRRKRKRGKGSWRRALVRLASAVMATSLYVALSRAEPHAHCAARPCRGSMVCSVSVSTKHNATTRMHTHLQMSACAHSPCMYHTHTYTHRINHNYCYQKQHVYFPHFPSWKAASWVCTKQESQCVEKSHKHNS